MTLPRGCDRTRKDGLWRTTEEWDVREDAMNPESSLTASRSQLCECWYCRNGESWQVRIGGRN